MSQVWDTHGSGQRSRDIVCLGDTNYHQKSADKPGKNDQRSKRQAICSALF